jgi:hypothetical protein
MKRHNHQSQTMSKNKKTMLEFTEENQSKKPKKSNLQMLSGYSSLFHNNNALVELGK